MGGIEVPIIDSIPARAGLFPPNAIRHLSTQIASENSPCGLGKEQVNSSQSPDFHWALGNPLITVGW